MFPALTIGDGVVLSSRSARMVAPIQRGSRLYGVLVLNVTAGYFAEEDLSMLQACVEHAALAWHNFDLDQRGAELRNRAETRSRRINHVQRVGARLKLDLDVDAIAHRVVEAAREALDFRASVLNLVDRPGDPAARARVVAISGLPPEAVAALTAHDYPVADIERIFRPEFRVSRSYFIPTGTFDISSETEITRWVNDDFANVGENAWRAGDELLVPLTDAKNGCLIGFISVDDPESGLRPGREEAEVLEIFADQAVAALRNAALLGEARRLAEQDPLTGLLNHRSAHKQLELEFACVTRAEEPLGIVLVDLDDFKLINDSHGHQAGDLALQHVAGLLRSCVRPGDVTARVGGDEFLLILPGASRSQAEDVAQRVVSLVCERPLPVNGVGSLPLRLSVGFASYPDDAAYQHALLAKADSSLYDAKRSGRMIASGSDGNRESAQETAPGFDLLNALVHTVGNKDRYTLEHSEQVVTYACLLASRLGLSPQTQRTLRVAGLIHDVGKVGVPHEVLRKPGPLSDSERALMREHVVLSTTLVQALIPDLDVVAAVAHHHERWDGGGYPNGVAGDDVPLVGRIMIVADAVSAMCVDRPYRSRLSRGAVVRELRKHSGSQFDPSLVDVFIPAFRETTKPQERQSSRRPQSR
ncbi:MAG TPA: diguanylate cyclase [Chloroflexota bacterium]|nr:diguanylate cyclase [Chloroflexota bacterium]